MSDTIDNTDDTGDVSGFPVPKRHQEDINEQVSELRDMLLEFMMEHMVDYAELNARDFAIHCAHSIGFLVRLYTSDIESMRILKEVGHNYQSGMSDAEEALENREEDADGA
jgi:hypothetical protein